MNHPIRILNLGAGVQSTTVALMGVKNWEAWHCSEALPYEPVGLIDYAIFADTQEEAKSVYLHLEWLKNRCQRFFPVLVTTAGKLGDDLQTGRNSTGQRAASIPAFTIAADTGMPEGMLRRQCTREYKIEPIWKMIRREILGLNPGQRLPADTDIENIYGLSYDEAGRIARVQAIERDKAVEVKFPLFELEMTRGSCKAWLRKHGPSHEVPRSACVFCPYKQNSEWRILKQTDAPGWERALEIDHALRVSGNIVNRGLNQQLFVHRDCVPLEEANLDDPETKERKKGQEMFGFLNECEGMCGV